MRPIEADLGTVRDVAECVNFKRASRGEHFRATLPQYIRRLTPPRVQLGSIPIRNQATGLAMAAACERLPQVQPTDHPPRYGTMQSPRIGIGRRSGRRLILTIVITETPCVTYKFRWGQTSLYYKTLTEMETPIRRCGHETRLSVIIQRRRDVGGQGALDHARDLQICSQPGTCHPLPSRFAQN